MRSFRQLRKTLQRPAHSHNALSSEIGSSHTSPKPVAAAPVVDSTATPQSSSKPNSEQHLFNYTSGRWLYNESLRLKERYLKFNVSELKRAIAEVANSNEGDVKSFKKLAEGGFNRAFEATMKDGLQIVARLPYPSTLPKRYAVASEVATMDLARIHGVPVPQVFSYAITADNAVGSEYIIMEKISGNEIGHTWYDLSVQDRKSVTLDVAKLEASLFSIPLPASGSIYYKKDLLETDRSIDIAGHEGFCVGPDASLSWWYERRDTLSIDRGPFIDAGEAMKAGALKELAWMKQYGSPRFPFDRHRREFLEYEKSSSDEHIRNLESYLEIAQDLVPDTQSLLRPTLRHPDLQPHNIFVSDDFKIVGLIDWQHCSVLPLFLQSGVPKYWQNTSDEPVIIEKPSLPLDYEQLDPVEKAQAMQEYRQRQIHLLYLGGTTRFNPQHMDAYLTEGVSFKRRIFEHASAPWEGDNIALKADLILAARNWTGLTTHSGTENDKSGVHMTQAPCPVSFAEEEAEACLRLDLLLQGVDGDIARVRENIGIGSDGWVPHDGYKDAVERNEYIRQKVIDQSHDEEVRDLGLKHYPFNDHAENE